MLYVRKIFQLHLFIMVAVPMIYAANNYLDLRKSIARSIISELESIKNKTKFGRFEIHDVSQQNYSFLSDAKESVFLPPVDATANGNLHATPFQNSSSELNISFSAENDSAVSQNVTDENSFNSSDVLNSEHQNISSIPVWPDSNYTIVAKQLNESVANFDTSNSSIRSNSNASSSQSDVKSNSMNKTHRGNESKSETSFQYGLPVSAPADNQTSLRNCLQTYKAVAGQIKSSYYIKVTYDINMSLTNQTVSHFICSIIDLFEDSEPNNISLIEVGLKPQLFIIFYNTSSTFQPCVDKSTMVRYYNRLRLLKNISDVEIINRHKCVTSDVASYSRLDVLLAVIISLVICLFTVLFVVQLRRCMSKQSTHNMLQHLTRPTGPVILNGEVGIYKVSEERICKKPNVLPCDFAYGNLALDLKTEELHNSVRQPTFDSFLNA